MRRKALIHRKHIKPRGGIKKRVTGRIKRKKGGLKSISQLIKEADKLFSIQVRMNGAYLKDGEWWNRDYTTGYAAPVKKLHCGHYLSRYYKAARWNFDNARPQSYMSNIHMHGDPIRFRQNLVLEIGKARVLAVEKLRDAPIKLTRKYLEALIEELKTSA